MKMRTLFLSVCVLLSGGVRAQRTAEAVVFSESSAPIRFSVQGDRWTPRGEWIARGETCVQPVCAAAARGTVYVADRVRGGRESDGRILRYSPSGKYLGVFKEGLGFCPSCLAVSPDGVWLYAACAFDRRANTLWRWRLADGAGGNCSPPEFETVRTMAFGSDGLLYASCRGMSAVRVFETGDQVMLKGSILSPGAATGGLVMDDTENRLYLPGRCLDRFDLVTGERTRVDFPSPMNFLGGGRVAGGLYVTERGSGTIRPIGPDGVSTPVARVPQAMGFVVLSDSVRAPRRAVAFSYARLFRSPEGDFRPVPFNNSAARPFLKGGLCTWVTPIDVTGDGRLDLVLQSWCATPRAGMYVAEAVSGEGANTLFRPPRRISHYGSEGLSACEVDGRRVLTSVGGLADAFPSVRAPVFTPWRDLPWNVHWDPIGRNVWRLADLNGDGRQDLLVGVSDTREYGWGDFYEPRGNYRNGRPHGYLWWIPNEGTGSGLPGGTGVQRWGEPALLRLENRFPVEALGHVFPMAHDWDADGDPDLLCADASGTISYFENVGTKTCPVWTGETFPRGADGRRIDTYLNQTTAACVDFDQDGKMDVVLSEEDGRAGLMRGTGRLDSRRAPVFERPVYFRQEAEDLNYSSLPTPCAADWDGDGDLDLISGEAGGAIAWIENLSGPGADEPSWDVPKPLSCEPPAENPLGIKTPMPLDFQVFQHDPIRIQAGSNGSMLGPVEAKYGYTVLSVADWDGDGLPDLMASSIWGKPLLFRNIGSRTRPRLAAPAGVSVAWPDHHQPPVPWGWFHPDRTKRPDELISQWRTTPYMTDLNDDALTDLVMQDHEGFFAFFERVRQADGTLTLNAPVRAICDEKGMPINLTYGKFGAGGRRKFCFCDWDGDGITDFLVNGVNVDFHKGLGRGKDGKWRFRNEGPMGLLRLAGHTTSPTPADFDGDGIPSLIVGAEDGFFYRLDNPRAQKRPRRFTVRKDPAGTSWFVSPGGTNLFLTGIDHVRHMGWYCEQTQRKEYEEHVLRKYGSRAVWETNALSRLKKWGFNAFGVGCDPSLRRRGLWHTEILHLGDTFSWKGGDPDHAICPNPTGIPSTAFPNVFSPDFAAWCRTTARKKCSPFVNETELVGYFIDNELCWWGRRGNPAEGMFETVADLPVTHSARRALETFVRAHGGRRDAAVKRAFLAYAAETYFRVTTQAIREADPGRLILGCRFANLDGMADLCVAEAAGRWCDVVSYNCYPWADLDRQAVFFNSFPHARRIREMLDEIHAVSRRPLMITEWSFPALDAGLPCRNGAGQRFQTQAQRAEATGLFAELLVSCPYVVGYNYFMWPDQPKEGISRAFPEDSNYGLVNGEDEPYTAVTEALSAVQNQIERRHGRPCRSERIVPPSPPVLADEVREKRSAHAAAGTDVSFRQIGKTYRITDGSGLVLEGRVGDAKTFSKVEKDGKRFGTFGVMICREGGHRWENARKVKEVVWRERARGGMLTVTEEGGEGGARWSVRTAYTFVAGTGTFLCELLDVQNLGTEPLTLVSFFFRQIPAFKTRCGRACVPGEWVWKGCAQDGWRDTDGTFFGAFTRAPAVRKFRYFTVDDFPLPDAEFSLSENADPVVLPPGASVSADGRVWMVSEQKK